MFLLYHIQWSPRRTHITASSTMSVLWITVLEPCSVLPVALMYPGEVNFFSPVFGNPWSFRSPCLLCWPLFARWSLCQEEKLIHSYDVTICIAVAFKTAVRQKLVVRNMVMGRSIALTLSGSVGATVVQMINKLCFNCKDPMAVRRGTCRWVYNWRKHYAMHEGNPWWYDGTEMFTECSSQRQMKPKYWEVFTWAALQTGLQMHKPKQIWVLPKPITKFPQILIQFQIN